MTRICFATSSSVGLDRGARGTRKMCARHLKGVTFVSLGLFAFSVGGCSPSQGGGGPSNASNCPSPDRIALVNLGCVPVEPPVVNTTGPCTSSAASIAEDILLTSNDAGTCHVQITFESGATSSVDVDFVSVAPPLSGCDQGFVAVSMDGGLCVPNACELSLPEPICDAGLDSRE
jgi:hypothetical protein